MKKVRNLVKENEFRIYGIFAIFIGVLMATIADGNLSAVGGFVIAFLMFGGVVVAVVNPKFSSNTDPKE